VFEELEEYVLLSASIVGTVVNDQGGTGVLSPGAPGVPGESVFLDLDHNHQDQTVTTVAATSTTIVPVTGQLGGLAAGTESSSLQVQGLPGTITDLTVTMDLANNGSSPVTVALISPVGQTVPNLPNLFQILPGEHFVGSFNQNASTPITEATGLAVSGTFVPEQFLSDPPAHIIGTNPNGTWGLVFFGDASQLALKSWSLTITTPDPMTTTDALGNYSFSGLVAGTYDVETLPSPGEPQTSPAAGVGRTVEVADGQTATGVDFGVQTASDLKTTSFYLSSPATAWGQNVTINYTLTNSGKSDASAFDVAVLLSADGALNTSNPLLQTFLVPGLAAGATTSGSLTVALPSTAPAGFAETTQSYIGFFIDPSHLLAHNVTTDAVDEELGVGEAALSVAPNQAVTSGSSIEQMPSIAVDPANPNHLVLAYLDYGLVTTGYAGIGVEVSNDGGTTWYQSSVPLAAGFDQGASAPTVEFDGQGGVHVSFMAATFLGPKKPSLTNPNSSQRLFGFQSNNGIFVASSQDGGLTWGQPVAVVSHTFSGAPGTSGTTGPNGTQVPFDSGPSFAVDTYKTLPGGQANPYYGDLYVAWTRVYPVGEFPGDPTSTDGSDIMFSVSTDGGQTWATQLQTQPVPGQPGDVQVSAIRDPEFGTDDAGAAGKGFSFYPQVSIGPEGDIYVSAYEGGFFVVFHSADNGASFRTPDYNDQLGVPFPNPVLPSGFSAADAFRTLPVRDIVADPSHPGRVYVVEANSVNNVDLGATVDTGDVIFAVSNDYGQTWEDQFQVGNEATNLASLPPGQNDAFQSVLNDDNGGNFVGFDSLAQLNQQVLSGQALPSLAVDASGRLTVIWYDTRRDPSGVGTDVFATVSSDGGKTFTSNFRVTDTTFNPYAGGFQSATGATTYYLGDRISVAASDGIAYALWTDTRNGGQQIFLQKYSLTVPPQAPLDRFYPNSTPQLATSLGPITSRTVLPLLKTGPGDDNWYNFQGGDDGTIDLVVTVDSGSLASLHIELTDGNGNVLPAMVTPVLDASGLETGLHLVYPSLTGETYLVHVSGDIAIGYSLALTDLTAELGPVVQGSQAGVMAAGATEAYRLEAGVSGTLQLTLTPGADAVSQMVLLAVNEANSNVQSLLGQTDGSGAGVAQTLSIPVTQGDVVVLIVTATDATSAGTFTLQYTNLDQFESPGNTALFLPTAGSPASVAVADLAGSSAPSIVVSSTDTTDTVMVFSGNADGTFQAARQYAVNAGLSGVLTAGYRQIGVADFNGDGTTDIVVPNFRAGDVSVLLGNGADGFEPQRTVDAVPSPDSLVTGDFVTGSNDADVAVLQNFPQLGGVSQLAVLIGRGDGTFRPAVTYRTVFTDGAGPMVVGDFTGNGIEDIIVFSKNSPVGQIFLGNGDGTFHDGGVFSTGENVYAAEAVDLNGDGTLSLITTGTNSGSVYVIPGNGDGTFGPAFPFTALRPVESGTNVGVFGLAVVGFKSTVAGSVPMSGLGMITGQPGVYVTAQPRGGSGGQVVFLPALFDDQSQFNGFGAAQPVASLNTAGKIVAFNAGGATDLAATDNGGVWVIEDVSPPATGGATVSIPTHNTPQTAQNLGSAAHITTLPQAIVAGYEDAYYTYQVPTEDVPGSGAEVVDFSALFKDVGGAGLGMEVLDAAGNVLGSGDRFRIIAAQGSVLTVHVFGEPAAAAAAQGTGVYTLDIDVLPQVLSVQALSPIPGGPKTSIVLTFQGDNLDLASAEDPANYSVIYLGPGTPGVIPIAATSGGQPIIYDPGVNVDVTSGLTYPTAVDQTVTLLFTQPLAAGSYEVVVAPAIQAAAFNAAEAGELAPGDGSFAGHPVVTVTDGLVANGAQLTEPGLVAGPVASTGQASAVAASLFLTQLQADLAAVLKEGLQAAVDDSAITTAVNDDILARYLPLYMATERSFPSLTIIWLDPVSIDLQSPQGVSLSYNLSTNALANGLGSSFVSVGGNVEMIVMENAAGTFNLDVANVASTAQGGAVELSASGVSSQEFTAQLQGGQTGFQLALGAENASSGSSGESSGGVVGSPGGIAGAAGAAQTLASVSAGPVTFAGATNAALSTGSSAATTAAVQTGGATGAGQPLLAAYGQSLSDDYGQDQLDEGTPSKGLKSLRSILGVLKQALSRLSGVMDALGRKGPATAVLRNFSAILDTLIGPATPARANAGGARNDAVRNANPWPGRTAPSALLDPAPESTPVPGGITTVLWDHGIDGLLQERDRSGSGALCAAAFLASGLVGFEFGRRPAARFPKARMRRSERRE
jgi:hypothetical protein